MASPARVPKPAAAPPVAPIAPQPRRSPPRNTAPPALRLRTDAPPPSAGALPPPALAVVRAPGPGEPLAADVRAALGRSLAVDVASIRVHADARAQEAASSVGARAFAYGTHVFLGPGERPGDLDLLAHEVAHVVQQQGGPAVQAYGGRGDTLETEASSVSQAVRQGERATVTGRTAPRVQRRPWYRRAISAVGGAIESGAHAVRGAVEAGIEWVEDRAWSLVRRFAPELEPILHKGLLEWLKEKISAAVETVWNTLMAPVRTITGFVDTLRTLFRNLVAWMRQAAAEIAHGDCSSIADAAHRVEEVLHGLASPVVDRVKHAAKRVGDFFTDLWDRFGAPVWDWLKRMGGAIWERIQAFGSWLWEKTEPIRDALGRAWSWIKRKLGIGEGAEGQNGLLQWVQRKAADAWSWIKARIEPYKKQLLAVAGVLLLLSPAGPLIVLGAAVGGLIVGARWIAQHLRQRDGIVRNRSVVEGTIIPGINRAVDAVTHGIQRAASWLTEKLGAVVARLASAAGVIAGSIFGFALSVLTWLLNRFRALAEWAGELVQGLAGHVRNGLDRLRSFLRPVLDVLRALGRVVANVLEIAGLVLGRFWRAIPACIRNPIVDFVTNQILRRVPIFSSLVAIPDIWPRIRATALRVIRQVFRDGDLAGAAMTVFRFLLDLLQIPVDLVRAIFQKAASVLDLILAAPVQFLRNVLSALKQGFVQFFGAIGRHLLSGITNWLFGQLRDAGIAVPTELSFGSIFRLVLDILGLTLDRVLRIVERRVRIPGIADRIRRFLSFMTGVWEFVARLITEGPAALWRWVQERLSNLWETARGMIVDWIESTVIGQVTKKLLSMLDPTGIMAVVNSIIAFYRAVQSALEYARQILEIVNSWFDTLTSIATGAIAGAATMFENLLDRALPVAIGFLANQVGLRGLGRRVREMVAAIQERIEEAIEAVVDRALATGRGVLERLGLGPAPAAAPAAAAPAAAVSADAPLEDEQFEEEAGHGVERHRLYFEPEGQEEELMIASTPQRLRVFLASAGAVPRLPRRKRDLLREASALADAIDAATVPAARATPAGRQRIVRLRHELTLKIKQLIHRIPLSRFDDVYQLEGHVATFADMPRQHSDALTPDHQPQAAVLQYLAGRREFRGTAIVGHAANRAALGLCINVDQGRHMAGRTYGSKGSQTLADFETAYETATARTTSDERMRERGIALLRAELRADVSAMRAVLRRPDSDPVWADVNDEDWPDVEKPRLIQRVRDQVLEGEAEMSRQDLERLAR